MVSTSLIHWEKDLIVGIESIDKQHFLLTNQLNLAFELYKENNTKESLDALERFVLTIKNHFASEESIMQSNSYPNFDEHCSLHTKLFEQINKLYHFLVEGKSVLNDEVFDFLKSWLLDHIKQSDRELGIFLNLR